MPPSISVNTARHAVTVSTVNVSLKSHRYDAIGLSPAADPLPSNFTFA